MISDNFLRLSEAQSPVNSSGNAAWPAAAAANVPGLAYSANYVDLLQARDIGDGNDLNVQLYCTEGLSSDQTWSATIVLTAAPYTLVAGSLIVGSFGFIGGAAAAAGFLPIRKLTVGDRLVARISPLTFSLGLRYLYVVFSNHAATQSTAGKFTIDVCTETETTSGGLSYPIGYTVV